MSSDDDIFVHPTKENDWQSPNLEHTLGGKACVINNSHLPINLQKDQVTAHIMRANDKDSPQINNPTTLICSPKVTSNFSSVKYNP